MPTRISPVAASCHFCASQLGAHEELMKRARVPLQHEAVRETACHSFKSLSCLATASRAVQLGMRAPDYKGKATQVLIKRMQCFLGTQGPFGDKKSSYLALPLYVAFMDQRAVSQNPCIEDSLIMILIL